MAPRPPPSTASPSASRSTDRPGMLGRVASAIGEAGGDDRRRRPRRGRATTRSLRDITVDAADSRALGRRSSRAVDAVDGAERRRHDRPHVPAARRRQDRAAQQARRCKTRDDLSMAYTPGVARVCTAIAEDPDKAFQYTIKRNTVAVVSDGTAVLGLGDIGPRGGDAGDGGQGDALQGVRRRRRLPDLPRHQGPRRDRRDRRSDRARLRRHQPRGHLARRAASRSRSG